MLSGKYPAFKKLYGSTTLRGDFDISVPVIMQRWPNLLSSFIVRALEDLLLSFIGVFALILLHSSSTINGCGKAERNFLTTQGRSLREMSFLCFSPFGEKASVLITSHLMILPSVTC
jgi:hypothetical protein